MEDLKILIEAVEVAQSKGVYTLHEAVLINNAIVKLQQELSVKPDNVG